MQESEGKEKGLENIIFSACHSHGNHELKATVPTDTASVEISYSCVQTHEVLSLSIDNVQVHGDMPYFQLCIHKWSDQALMVISKLIINPMTLVKLGGTQNES